MLLAELWPIAGTTGNYNTEATLMTRRGGLHGLSSSEQDNKGISGSRRDVGLGAGGPRLGRQAVYDLVGVSEGC